MKNQPKAAAASTEAPAKAETAKRKMLTPAEKVAKLERDLAEAKAKAEEKANKAANEARDKRTKLVEKRDALNVQIAELDKVIGEAPATEASEG